MNIEHLVHYQESRSAAQIALIAGVPVILAVSAVSLLIYVYGTTMIAGLWSLAALVAVIFPAQMLQENVDDINQKKAADRYRSEYLYTLSEGELLGAIDSPEFTEAEKELLKQTLNSHHPAGVIGLCKTL